MGVTGAVKSITHSYTWNEYLYWYIERKDIKNIQWVLDSKPDIIDKPLTVNYKTTPLHRASVNGSTEICKLLLQKYKAGPDVLTQNGQTPLMGAAKRDHVETVRYLLTMGADTSVVSSCGLLAIQYAILGGFYETALAIYEKMRNKDLKSHLDYEDLGNNFYYRYVNYQVFLDHLIKQVDPDNVPDFLTKTRVVYNDPVIDPRETWGAWFKRQMDFKDPPLCQRDELPDKQQPQNRFFGKMHHYMSRLSMTHRTQKPSLYPKKAMTEVDSHDQFPNKNEMMSEQVEMKSMGDKEETHSVG